MPWWLEVVICVLAFLAAKFLGAAFLQEAMPNRASIEAMAILLVVGLLGAILALLALRL